MWFLYFAILWLFFISLSHVTIYVIVKTCLWKFQEGNICDIISFSNRTIFFCLTRRVYLFIAFFFLFVFCLYRGAPLAHGGSQVRGPIGAVAAGLHQSHSHAGFEPRLRPTPQLTATPDLQPTEGGQGLNHNLMVPSWIRFHWATTGSPALVFWYTKWGMWYFLFRGLYQIL